MPLHRIGLHISFVPVDTSRVIVEIGSHLTGKWAKNQAHAVSRDLLYTRKWHVSREIWNRRFLGIDRCCRAGLLQRCVVPVNLSHEPEASEEPDATWAQITTHNISIQWRMHGVRWLRTKSLVHPPSLYKTPVYYRDRMIVTIGLSLRPIDALSDDYPAR